MNPEEPARREEKPPLPSRRDFDTTVAHPARVWDYWLGGKDNFAADRQAAERVLDVMPAMGLIARTSACPGQPMMTARCHRCHQRS